MPKEAKAKRDGVINPWNYNFYQFQNRKFWRSQNATNQPKSTVENRSFSNFPQNLGVINFKDDHYCLNHTYVLHFHRIVNNASCTYCISDNLRCQNSLKIFKIVPMATKERYEKKCKFSVLTPKYTNCVNFFKIGDGQCLTPYCNFFVCSQIKFCS